MSRYILKSALVAELKSIITTARIKAEIASANSNVTVAALWSGKENVCNELRSLLDAQKVREVELDEDVARTLQVPVSKDLEEAAVRFATDAETGKVDTVKQSAFLWGTIYCMQQIKSNAIEGRLSSTISGSEQNVVAPAGYGEYGKDGDKVKVIILRED